MMKPNHSANIITPLIAAQNQMFCFEFYFQMFGQESKTLNVYITNGSAAVGGADCVWSFTGKNTADWTLAKITVSFTHNASRVILSVCLSVCLSVSLNSYPVTGPSVGAQQKTIANLINNNGNHKTSPSQTTTASTTKHKEIDIKPDCRRSGLLIPGWFQIIEIGLLVLTGVVGIGLLGCCCLKFCGGKKDEDEEDEEEDKKGYYDPDQSWKANQRAPASKPGGWMTGLQF